LASAFAVTAGMFAVMSLYGFFTRRDLSAWGSLLFMGLIGVILATIVSFFWHNSILNVLINYIGVLVFVGLTAYDTQMLRQIAVETSADGALAARLSITGALWLYLDFLNLFLFLLRSMNDRR
jgi:FtsH-binding integral membrane protein